MHFIYFIYFFFSSLSPLVRVSPFAPATAAKKKKFWKPRRAGQRPALFPHFSFPSTSSPAAAAAAAVESEMAPAIGSRRLTVLREFRPHGLAAEEADGEGGPGERPPQDYDYFLFDPALAASPAPEPGEEAASSSSGADGDHELFIRGNRCARHRLRSTVTVYCWWGLGVGGMIKPCHPVEMGEMGRIDLIAL